MVFATLHLFRVSDLNRSVNVIACHHVCMYTGRRISVPDKSDLL